MSDTKINPLMSYMRQPKVSIRLPSNYVYWPPGSIEVPETGELSVYSMTAKDELVLKTPDALMNGQGVVDMIQSCIPAIKNAWLTPNIDLDIILLSIRLATYGNMLDVNHTVPGTKIELEQQVDIGQLLNQLSNLPKWKEDYKINEFLTCYIKPLSYKQVTKAGLKSFEAQRLAQSAALDGITEEQKVDILSKTISKAADMTIDLMADSISKIQTPNEFIEDRSFIIQFLENIDRNTFQKLKDHVIALRSAYSLKPFLIESTAEQIKAGAPKTYELPITMDNSDFFGKSS